MGINYNLFIINGGGLILGVSQKIITIFTKSEGLYIYYIIFIRSLMSLNINLLEIRLITKNV